jgi:hypothetical protein
MGADVAWLREPHVLAMPQDVLERSPELTNPVIAALVAVDRDVNG